MPRLPPERRRRVVAALLALYARWQAEEATAASRRAAARRRRRRLLLLRLSAIVALLKRREVKRADGGWEGSTLNGYVESGDEATYKKKFRCSKANFDFIVQELSTAGYVVDNKCRSKKLRMTARFKVAVCLYYLAHRGSEVEPTADVASVGESTVRLYLRQFSAGVLKVLRPHFMPATKPTAERIRRVRSEFAGRRGIAEVALAVDGTHIPFKGGPDYKNYKGWESILDVSWVNSFYLFVDADVGYAGKCGDNGVIAQSALFAQIKADPEAWLGKDGVVSADGGCSDGGVLLLNPIPNAVEQPDLLYNLCHSSTRFFVEETFGRWKNRWRFLLSEINLDHALAVQLIYVTKVLHNLLTHRMDDAVDFTAGTDEEWEEFFDTFERDACPECTRRKKMHCPHMAGNRNARCVASGPAAQKRFDIRDALWERMRDDYSAELRELRAAMERRAEAARAE